MSINKRIEVLDIIRGVSIWMVILVHSQQKFSDLSDFFDILKFGQMGCQIFIVLSRDYCYILYRNTCCFYMDGNEQKNKVYSVDSTKQRGLSDIYFLSYFKDRFYFK